MQSVLTKPSHRAFFDNVSEWWSMQHQKNYNERYSIRNECVKSGSLMNVRILKRLSSKTEAVLRSNAYLSSQTSTCTWTVGHAQEFSLRTCFYGYWVKKPDGKTWNAIVRLLNLLTNFFITNWLSPSHLTLCYSILSTPLMLNLILILFE